MAGGPSSHAEEPMQTRDYFEELWEQLPAGLEPADFDARLRFLLARVRAGERVLDVGCGEGRFTAALAERGVRAVGVDVAEEPLRRARARRPELDLELHRVAPAGPWPFADASFDAVWAGEVIEHVADTAGWLSELRRVLRSGGLLLLSTPAHDLFTRLRLGVSARAFAERLDPRADHLRFYTRAGLRELLADFGFEDVELRGLGGVPGARRALLLAARRSRF